MVGDVAAGVVVVIRLIGVGIGIGVAAVGAGVIPTEGAFISAIGWGNYRGSVATGVASGLGLVMSRLFINCTLISVNPDNLEPCICSTSSSVGSPFPVFLSHGYGFDVMNGGQGCSIRRSHRCICGGGVGDGFRVEFADCRW